MPVLPAALFLACFTGPTGPTGPTAEVLTHAPAPGSSERIELRRERTTQGGALRVVMNGSEVPAQFLPTIELETLDVRTLDCTQTWTEVSPDERAWLRRYDEARWHHDGSMSLTGTDPFTWDMDEPAEITDRTLSLQSEDGEAPTFEVLDGPPHESFEGLLADLSLAQLLPGDEVDVGERWSADGAELGQLWEPGGELGWELPAEAAANLGLAFDERTLGGELELELLAVETEGDRRIAVCSVRGELTRRTIRPGNLEQVPVVDGTATDTENERLELAGELRWDLARGTVAALTLEGRAASTVRTVRDPGQDGPTYHSDFTIEGEYRLELTCRPADEAVSASD